VIAPEPISMSSPSSLIILLVGVAVATVSAVTILSMRVWGKQASPPLACDDVAYDSGGQAVSAVLCRPSATGVEAPGVVYLHGVGGPEEVPNQILRRLAAEGFVVLAPAYFARTPAPGPDPGSFLHVYMTRQDDVYSEAARQWPGVIADGVSFLQGQPGVAANRIGVVGYSLGGALALAGAAPDARYGAVVSIAGFTELAGFPELSRFITESFKSQTADLPPLLLVHGERDAAVPVTQARAIAATAEAAGRPTELAIHGGDHSVRGAHGRWSSQRIVEFLRRELSR